MKKKFIIGILIAITLVMYVSAVFGMMHHNNDMNKGHSSMNQASGYNNNYNRMINSFYISNPYKIHMNRDNFSYMENSFSNNMMNNNFNQIKYRYRNFEMMQMH